MERILKGRKLLPTLLIFWKSQPRRLESKSMDYAKSLDGKLIKKIKQILCKGSYELNRLSWPFWSQLQFLRPVMTATKSKDNLIMKPFSDVEDEEDEEDVQSPPLTTTKKRNTTTLPSKI